MKNKIRTFLEVLFYSATFTLNVLVVATANNFPVKFLGGLFLVISAIGVFCSFLPPREDL